MNIHERTNKKPDHVRTLKQAINQASNQTNKQRNKQIKTHKRLNMNDFNSDKTK